jgi:hypothetical protein
LCQSHKVLASLSHGEIQLLQAQCRLPLSVERTTATCTIPTKVEEHS